METTEKNMEHKILEAAEKLFIEQGFTKTTTGQIAKSAGCNQALVHYYYRTKDNLFEKIFEKKIRFMLTHFLTINSAELSFEEKITRMIAAHLDFLKQNSHLVPFLLNEMVSNPERLKAVIVKIQDYPKSFLLQLSADLNKEIEKGTIRQISPIDLLLTIISLHVFAFWAKPILVTALNISDKEFQQILEHRKQEITETVLSRLKK